MHIPDGFLTPPVWAAMDLLTVPAVGWMARRAQSDAGGGISLETRLPLLGVMGAFVFAAQMINFPVGLGTSGHLVGGALLACVLGPAPAAIVMTAILAIQSFVFQDGGILALGANIFNMAIAGVLAGYLPYHFLGGSRFRSLALFLGGFLSVLASACLALSQLLLSQVRMPAQLLWVSLGLFVVSAALEGAITLAVVRAIERLNPQWIREPGAQANRSAIGFLLISAVLLAAVGVLFASSDPDGLEHLIAQIGLVGHEKPLFSTPLADYEIKGLSSVWLRKAAAGLTGLGLIYAACLALGRWLKPRRSA